MLMLLLPPSGGSVLRLGASSTDARERSGATLVEVLVAIFVMGLGLIALLTLFPLGVLRMQQALQDQACAEAVANANAVATLRDFRNDPQVVTPPLLPVGPGAPAPDVFKDTIANQGRQFPADPLGPSYPVFVDPVGYLNANGVTRNWLGATGVNSRGWIARAPSTSVWSAGNRNSAAFKWFARLDDYLFDDTEAAGGTPIQFAAATKTNPPVLRRDLHYSWAYLMQRPRSSDPTMATCAVVVYNKRPLALTANLGLAETTYQSTYNIGTNTFSVDWGSQNLPAPNVRAGDWILDATFVRTQKTAGGVPVVPPQFFGTNHAFFYRVVGVTETSNTAADYEVQQPIRSFPMSAFSQVLPNPNNANNACHIMILDGVADVFERYLDRKFN